MNDAMTIPVESAVLEELKEILEDEFPLLVNTYIDDVDKRMVKLRSAIEAVDSAQVKAEAHALKGSSRNLGVNPLADLFADLEAMGSAGEITGAEKLLLDIEQELIRAQEFLRAQI